MNTASPSNRLTRTFVPWAAVLCFAISLGLTGCCGTCGNGCSLSKAPAASNTGYAAKGSTPSRSYATKAPAASAVAQDESRPAQTVGEWMGLKQSVLPANP